MAILDLHIRFLWGLLTIDEAAASTPGYANPTQYALLGDTAAEGVGIGVRRATLIMERDLVTPADDEGQMHFDFLNITGGAPDDTWTEGDFTTMETKLLAFYTAVKPFIPTWFRLHRIAWHRVGPGVPKPNPAERILELVTPVAGTAGNFLPPQGASTLTFRTGVRHSWGRTYVPFGKGLDATGRIDTGDVDGLATAAQSLFTSAAGADFHPVVTSIAKSSALGIDTVEVDNTVDIVRRRRWKHTTYRKLLAA